MITIDDAQMLDFIRKNMLFDRPALFYKFRRVIGDHLEGILKNKTLMFADPTKWNDPWDGQIIVETTGTRQEMTRWAKATIAQMPRQRAREFARRVEKDPAGWNKTVNAAARMAVQEQGLCCFSTSWKPVLQWSYYADGHKGVALGFDWKKDILLFAMALKVRYEERYPLYNYLREPERCIASLLTSKSKDWVHEEEVRIWRPPPGLKRYNPETLREVIFGARCTIDDIKKVKAWCKEGGFKHLQYFKTKVVPGTFSLEKLPYTPEHFPLPSQL
jgi:hypothetical protein